MALSPERHHHAGSLGKQPRARARRWAATSRAVLVGLLATALIVVGVPATATAATRDSFDAQLVQLVNQARSEAGLSPLAHSADLRGLSGWWSDRMATGGTSCRLAHNPDAWNQLPSYGAASRTTWGENVGSWATDQSSARAVFDLYMQSPGHRANILGRNYRYIGVATVTGTGGCAGTDWNTMTFTDRVDNPGNVVTVDLPAGTVSFGAEMPTDAAVGGSFTPAIVAGPSTAAPVLAASGACSVRGDGAVSFDSAGTCTLTLDQAGDSQWSAAPQVTESFEVRKSPQTVSFASRIPAHAAVGVAYPVSARSTSSLPVVLAAAGKCTFRPGAAGTGTVTFTGAGSCTVTASQNGGGSWLPAPDASQAWRVKSGTSSDLSVSVTPDSASGFAGPVTATVTVRNSGTRDSGRATTRIVVSNGVIDAGGATVTVAGATASSRTLTWSARTVPAGKSITYRVVLPAPAPTTQLRAHVSTVIPDATPDDDRAARRFER